jgi:hypothetical protein
MSEVVILQHDSVLHDSVFAVAFVQVRNPSPS